MNEAPLITPVKYTSRCRLCGHKFTGNPLEAPINGVPDPRMMKMGEAYWKHMMTGDQAHKDYAVQSVMVASIILEDPVALQFVGFVRAMAFQALRRHWITDEWIHDQASRVTPETFEALMKDMRDFLTETGRHGPQIQTPPSVESKAVV